MRLLFSLTLLLVGVTLCAQYDKGNWYLEGNSILFDSPPYDHDGTTDFLMAGGNFVSRRLLIGGRVISTQDQEARIGVFGRYYLPLSRKGFNLFAEAEVAYSDFDGAAIFTAAGGAEYPLAPGLMLNGRLSYETGGRQSWWRLNLGLNLIMGETYRTDGGYNVYARQGSWLVGGQVSDLQLVRFFNNDFSIFGSATLSLGRFLTDHFFVDALISAGGLDFDLESDRGSNEVTGQSVYAALGIRYFLVPGRRVDPYVGAGVLVDYDLLRQERDAGLPSASVFESRETRPFTYLATGLLYHFNDRAALEGNLQYLLGLDDATANFLAGSVGLRFKLGR